MAESHDSRTTSGPAACGRLCCTHAQTKMRGRSVECADKVVNSVPFSCGLRYVSQTKWCLTIRLQEHNLEVQKRNDGFLAQHCAQCGCTPVFDQTVVLAQRVNYQTRVIIEATIIAKGNCVSKPSVALTPKELAYLDGGKPWYTSFDLLCIVF